MYEIIMTHNRPWTTREVLFFAISFVLVTYVFVRLFKKKRIVLSQVFAGELLFVFIMIVLASTVFTRMPNGMHTYELIPFWSWWRAVFGDVGLLKEIVLNVILFIPVGILLPFIFCEKIRYYKALLLGFCFSFVIECSQLLFCRGLFEWDDMIDNSIGAMIGCVLVNQLKEKISERRKSKVNGK